MNLEKLTVKAREAFARAQDLARSSNHQTLEPVHLLAALLAEKDGVVRPLLERIGANRGQIQAAAMNELAVRTAVPLLTDDDLAAMRAANDAFADALRAGDVVAAVGADDTFHRIPVDRSGNQAIRAVLDQYTPVLRRVEHIRFASLRGRDSVAQHAKIIAFAEAGDADAAAAETRQNWLTLDPRAVADRR